MSGHIVNCTFIKNYAAFLGGAVYLQNRPSTVINSVFINNTEHPRSETGAINAVLGATGDSCIFKTATDNTNNVHKLSPTMNVTDYLSFENSGEKLTFDLRTNGSMRIYNGNISISVYSKYDDSWVGNYSCLSGEGWTVNLPVGVYYAVFNTEYYGFTPVKQ